jgi:Protein of unknown function (DUF1091)
MKKNCMMCYCNITSKLFQVKFDAFFLLNGKKNLIISVPKFNFCDMMRREGQFKVLKIIADIVSKFGNMVISCPRKKDYYYMKNFQIDETTIMGYRMMTENVTFLFRTNIRDENEKTSGDIALVQIFFRRVAY